jgi:hypothetical protein
VSDLRALAAVAQAEQRYADATSLFRAILAQSPEGQPDSAAMLVIFFVLYRCVSSSQVAV